MRAFATRFYRSKAWRECRDAYLLSQHGLCERCGNAGLIVHHKIELTPENINDPNVTLNWDNLELVCLACHNATHMGGEATIAGLAFDSDGDLVKRQ